MSSNLQKLEQQRRAKEDAEKQDQERVARIKREEEEKMDRKRVKILPLMTCVYS